MSADCLVAALARAQAAFPTIVKTKTNPHYKSQYADLADVLAAVRPALAAQGIAVVQPVRVTDRGAELVTALLWGDQRIESCMPLDVDGKPQELGSRLTYLRRYQLAALCGVAADDDDDGNVASAATPRKAKPQRQVSEQAAPPDERRAEAAAWADALTGERATEWQVWKQEHPGWHKTAQAFDAAYLRLRDLVAAENTAQGAEPFDDNPPHIGDGPSQKQMRALFAALKTIDVGEAERHEWAAGYLGRDVASFADLSGADVARLIDIAAAEAEVA